MKIQTGPGHIHGVAVFERRGPVRVKPRRAECRINVELDRDAASDAPVAERAAAVAGHGRRIVLDRKSEPVGIRGGELKPEARCERVHVLLRLRPDAPRLAAAAGVGQLRAVAEDFRGAVELKRAGRAGEAVGKIERGHLRAGLLARDVGITGVTQRVEAVEGTHSKRVGRSDFQPGDRITLRIHPRGCNFSKIHAVGRLLDFIPVLVRGNIRPSQIDFDAGDRSGCKPGRSVGRGGWRTGRAVRHQRIGRAGKNVAVRDGGRGEFDRAAKSVPVAGRLRAGPDARAEIVCGISANLARRAINRPDKTVVRSAGGNARRRSRPVEKIRRGFDGRR